MSKHTNEPWHSRIFSTGECHVMSHGYRVATCDGPGGIGSADARRIAACVNALAGIPTETLEEDPGYIRAVLEGRDQ